MSLQSVPTFRRSTARRSRGSRGFAPYGLVVDIVSGGENNLRFFMSEGANRTRSDFGRFLMYGGNRHACYETGVRNEVKFCYLSHPMSAEATECSWLAHGLTVMN